MAERSLRRSCLEPGPSRRTRGHAEGQAGETLIESLLAIAVLSAIVLAAYAGLSMAITASSRHEHSARGETLLRSAAEWIQNPDVAYVDRAGCSGAGSYILPDLGDEQAGYAVAVDRIDFWTNPLPATQSPLPTEATVGFGASCPGTDRGLQRIRLTATGPDSPVQELTVVKRRP